MGYTFNSDVVVNFSLLYIRERYDHGNRVDKLMGYTLNSDEIVKW